MKRAITLLTLLTVFNLCFSQNFYEIKWKASDNINYTALVEFFNEEYIKVRVKYTNKEGVYKVAKYTCSGEYIYDNYGAKHFIFDGQNATIVYPEYQADGYSADNFIFQDIGDNGKFKNLYTIDNNAMEAQNEEKSAKASIKLLDPKIHFTQKYIYNFFEKNEPEYDLYTSLFLDNENREHYKLKIHNSCSRPIKVLLRYQDLDGEWKTKDWKKVNSGNTAYIENTRNEVFYYYAMSTDGKLYWTGEDNYKYYEGKRYGFKKSYINRDHYGSWTKELSCNNVEENETSEEDYVNNSVKVHLIIAADTNDSNIGRSTSLDMEAIENLFKSSLNKVNIKYTIQKIYGNNLKKSNIISSIENLNISPNDVIIFYYSGHGYNDVSTYNRFPNMSMPFGSDLGLEETYRYLKSKNARLTLTIGDLCNAIPRTRAGIKDEERLPLKSGFLFDSEKLKRLFIEAKGSLISTSSARGEFSYCSVTYQGVQDKGHFTKAFINAFTKEVSKVNYQKGDWEVLFTRAYREARESTSHKTNQNGKYGQSGFNNGSITY